MIGAGCRKSKFSFGISCHKFTFWSFFGGCSHVSQRSFSVVLALHLLLLTIFGSHTPTPADHPEQTPTVASEIDGMPVLTRTQRTLLGLSLDVAEAEDDPQSDTPSDCFRRREFLCVLWKSPKVVNCPNKNHLRHLLLF